MAADHHTRTPEVRVASLVLYAADLERDRGLLPAARASTWCPRATTADPVHSVTTLGGDVHFAVYQADPGEPPANPAWQQAGSSFPGLWVADLDATTEALADAGHPILLSHEARSWGCRVVVEDPDGPPHRGEPAGPLRGLTRGAVRPLALRHVLGTEPRPQTGHIRTEDGTSDRTLLAARRRRRATSVPRRSAAPPPRTGHGSTGPHRSPRTRHGRGCGHGRRPALAADGRWTTRRSTPPTCPPPRCGTGPSPPPPGSRPPTPC